jgi:hypothetical protein
VKGTNEKSSPADKVAATAITATHINEAINYRMLDRNLWK